MPYLYDNHLGGFYSSDRHLTFDEIYCKGCGDNDWEIGRYETLLDAWAILKDRTSIFGTGGYTLPGVCSFFTGLNRLELDDKTDIELLQLIEKAISTDRSEKSICE